MQVPQFIYGQVLRLVNYQSPQAGKSFMIVSGQLQMPWRQNSIEIFSPSNGISRLQADRKY